MTPGAKPADIITEMEMMYHSPSLLNWKIWIKLLLVFKVSDRLQYNIRSLIQNKKCH